MTDDSERIPRLILDLGVVGTIVLAAMATIAAIVAAHNDASFLRLFRDFALVALVLWPAGSLFFMAMEWLEERYERA